MSDLVWLSAAELGRLYRRRAVSPSEVVEALLAHIEATDPAINAFITVTADIAREQARRADDELASDPGGDVRCWVSRCHSRTSCRRRASGPRAVR